MRGENTLPITRTQACVKPSTTPTAAWQRRGALDIGPRWRGHRYTMHTAAARRHKALDSGPENDIEEPMPNASTTENTQKRHQ